MRKCRRWSPPFAVGVLALAAAVTLGPAPAGASTFKRASLEDLVAGHETIVFGEVVEVRSHWNEPHTFILTDVTLQVEEVWKGRDAGRELTLTLMGGTVGDLTTVIVGGASLERGSSYVVFAGRIPLPGVRGALTVPAHGQGVFEVVAAPDGLRAVSQASGHPLLPDAKGFTAPPGGEIGIPLSELALQVRERLEAPARSSAEVRR